MHTLFVGSTGPHAGKSLLCYGLARMAQERGLRPAYLKPLGAAPTVVDGVTADRDAAFLAAALGLDEPLTLISPVVLEQDPAHGGPLPGDQAPLERVLDAHRRLAASKDLVIVGGAGTLHEGRMLGLDALSLTARLDARLLLVVSFLDRAGLDTALAARDLLGEGLAGTVLNRVPPAQLDHFAGRPREILERAGIPVLGVFPRDEVLEATSVGELHRLLGGDLLVGGRRANLLVERVVVGAMNLESALKFLRSARNKAVITGGDRGDIQLAALETSTRCLILTGGHCPTDIILARAEERGVPVLVVRDDTFTVIEKVEAAMGKLHPHEQEKLDRAARMVAAGLDFDRLRSRLEN